jgi:hypothetical protein
MSNCDHTSYRMVPNRMKDYAFDPDSEPDYVEESYSTYEDIDLHRAKCSMCGDILYYSGAAKNYYENGVRTPGIIGLE